MQGTGVVTELVH